MNRKDETVEERQLASVVEGLTEALAKTTTTVNATLAQPSYQSAGSSVTNAADAIAASITGSLPSVSSVTKAVDNSIQKLSSPLGLLASLNPIVAGLAKLFGGGNSTAETTVLTRHERPDSLRINVGISDSSRWAVQGTDYSSSGLPRAITPAAAAPQVVVQVQAMDSRSFLDRRDDIAAAVRQALLESHSLNDVMSER